MKRTTSNYFWAVSEIVGLTTASFCCYALYFAVAHSLVAQFFFFRCNINLELPHKGIGCTWDLQELALLWHRNTWLAWLNEGWPGDGTFPSYPGTLYVRDSVK
jgi:hypothetical protein